MSPYILIPFAVFAFCCLRQFGLRSRVIRALERYPEILDAIPGPLMLNMSLHRYIMRDNYQHLGDEGLNHQIRRYRQQFTILICAWLVCMAFVIAGMQRG